MPLKVEIYPWYPFQNPLCNLPDILRILDYATMLHTQYFSSPAASITFIAIALYESDSSIQAYWKINKNKND